VDELTVAGRNSHQIPGKVKRESYG